MSRVVPIDYPLWYYNSFPYTTTPPAGTFTWFGAYPYVDVADEDTAYGEVTPATNGDWVAARLQAVGTGGVTGARIEGEYQCTGLGGIPKWGIFSGDDGATSFNWSGNLPAVTSWTTFSSLATFDTDPAADPTNQLPAMLDAISRGVLDIACGNPGYDFGINAPLNTVRVSWLRLTLLGSFLRNHRRTDGLGGNGPRNHRKDSIQGSLRNHGYR
jgi:hypothetical protein